MEERNNDIPPNLGPSYGYGAAPETPKPSKKRDAGEIVWWICHGILAVWISISAVWAVDAGAEAAGLSPVIRAGAALGISYAVTGFWVGSWRRFRDLRRKK